jgi:hypothetical protein
MAKVSIDEARRAKQKAGEAARQACPVTGVGLTRIGDSYAVKVNLAGEPASNASLPDNIDGVTIVYEVVGRISKRAMR